MLCRTPGSRTTTKTKGWLFSALGAWVAAVKTRATVSSSTSSARNERVARCVCTTSKKSATPGDGIERPGLRRRLGAAARWLWCCRGLPGLDWAVPMRPATLATHQPGWSLSARGAVDRNKTVGDRRQTVAESATAQEDVFREIIGEST